MGTKIGIISLGLIGGSILKVLSNKGYEIYAVTRSQDAIKEALAYTKNVSDNLNDISCCDIVFVCSPMSKTIEILDKLESIVSPTTIVADVCSLKKFVMQKQRTYSFIGSHPMAGTENSGFSASFAELFEGAKWVLTPAGSVSKSELDLFIKIIEKTGATPVLADAEEHDRAVALISHMPMLIAQALVKTAQSDSLAVKLASSGFRDMTRLALSNTTMANDMLAMNGQKISGALISLIENAKELLDDNYITEIEKIKSFRAAMYDSNGKNILN